jgi:SAM-dependent methyltransferase
MYDELQQWYKREGAIFIKDIGVRPGCLVLDFGCGKGRYTIPAAKVVGDSGRVFALDKDRSIYNKLIEKAASMGLNNIVAVQSLKELKLYLDNDSLDVVLFYDVLHSHYFTAAERKNLFESINTVMKAHSLLSIYPKHMDPAEIKLIRDSLEKLGFYLEREAEVHLIHDGSYNTGNIINFRKEYK